MGVLGVFTAWRLKGGVVPPPSVCCEGAGYELTLAAVGVESGSRLIGGRRNGWRDFPLAGGMAGGVSELAPLPTVKPLRC
jgi:hypothetical protein